jgi:hypothetical protein
MHKNFRKRLMDFLVGVLLIVGLVLFVVDSIQFRDKDVRCTVPIPYYNAVEFFGG